MRKEVSTSMSESMRGLGGVMSMSESIRKEVNKSMGESVRKVVSKSMSESVRRAESKSMS